MTQKTPTFALQHSGCLVIARGGPMFLGVDDLVEAMKYCEPGAAPVKLMADAGELASHEKAQGEDDA